MVGLIDLGACLAVLMFAGTWVHESLGPWAAAAREVVDTINPTAVSAQRCTALPAESLRP